MTRRGLGKFAQRSRYNAVMADEPTYCRHCGCPDTSHFSGPCRDPYVGEGAEGARASAQIDREELHTLDASDPRLTTLLASALRWEKQADVIEARS